MELTNGGEHNDDEPGLSLRVDATGKPACSPLTAGRFLLRETHPHHMRKNRNADLLRQSLIAGCPHALPHPVPFWLADGLGHSPPSLWHDTAQSSISNLSD